MLDPKAKEALNRLAAGVADHPGLFDALRTHWQPGARPGDDVTMAPDVKAAANTLSELLPPMTRTDAGVAALGEVFKEDAAGEVLLAWCAASTWRRDAVISKLLSLAAAQKHFRQRAALAARGRVIEGPLLDALACAPLLGDGTVIALPGNAEARARLEILLWEAGASALEVPDLGRWLWGSPETFDVMVRDPAHGTLRGRVLAARTLEVSVGGIPPTADPELVGRTLQVLQPLILHPEPLVWVHAARALGRLTGSLVQLEGTVLDWVLGESRVLRQRALTAFASLPAGRLKFLASQLRAILDAPDQEPLVLAALAAATPYLFFERREMWDRLARRIMGGDGGAIPARALAKGLATIWRRGIETPEVEQPLRALRDLARFSRSSNIDEARRWIEVTAITDSVDRAERDPLDLELGLENLVRLAAQYDDEEADARAARFAVTLGATFNEARRVALGAGTARHKAAAMNALEGCARAFALRLWVPLLATRPGGDPVPEPNLEETWKTLERAPSEILDLLRERRQTEGSDLESGLPLEVLALRLGAYALDACGEGQTLGPGRGPTAHDTCLWLRKLEGLADGSRELPAALKGALSALFWRLVDTTRGTALGEVDDLE